MRQVYFFLFFLLLLSLAAADSAGAELKWHIESSDVLNLSLDMNHHPNPGDSVPMTLTMAKLGVTVTNATVTAKAVEIGGSTADLNFTTSGDGSWTETYQFTSNGTYRLDFNATDTSNADGNTSFYVYVGSYSLDVAFLSPRTSYQTGETASATVYVTEENSIPVNYADGRITVTGPGGIFLQSPMTELGGGYYNHSFTLPSTAGNYTVTATITSGLNSQSASIGLSVSEAEVGGAPSTSVGGVGEVSKPPVLDLIQNNSITVTASEGDNFVLLLPGEKHHVFVKEVNPLSTVIEIRSDLKIVKLWMREVDLDGDGNIDVVMILNDIKGDTVSMTFTRPSPPTEEGMVIAGIEVEPIEPAELEPTMEKPKPRVIIIPALYLTKEQYFGSGSALLLCVLIHFIWQMALWRRKGRKRRKRKRRSRH